MEMRSLENIEGLGLDLTPPILPLAYSLSDPYLHSHCFSCFHPLSSSSSSSTTPNPTPIRYCSPSCSHLDSSIHYTSGEHHLFLTLQSYPTTWHSSTTDLRTALRLLHRFTQLNLLTSSDRVGGLLTNREKLKQDDEVFARISEGARFMSRARRLRDGVRDIDEEENDSTIEEELVLCIVLTNAVEVQVDDQHGLGVAVYGPSFSWINHSCSPNACYRFSISGPGSPEPTMRMSPFGSGDELVQMNNQNGFGGNGPRIVVRSIKTIKKGEEVCVAYTNLLQPKAARDLELWSRYAFICSCRRCSASPTPYVDLVLHAKSAANLEPTNASWDHNFCRDEHEELSDFMDDIISEYLSTGNAECCCDKLEDMFTHNSSKEQLQPAEQAWPTFKLHPLCHLSLNSYITLASVYKVRASELLSHPMVMASCRLEAFELSQTSAAYSLLLAGATNHLFVSDRSFIVSASHFWISAGEALLSLARSSVWDSISTQGCSISSLPSPSHGKCPLMINLEANMVSRGSQCISTEVEFKKIPTSFMDCASRLSTKVWPFLIQGKQYLKDIKDPIDFSWLDINDSGFGLSNALVSNHSLNSHCPDGDCCSLRCETVNINQDQEIKGSLLQLGVHILLYGAYLASISYGHPCYLTTCVSNILELKT